MKINWTKNARSTCAQLELMLIQIGVSSRQEQRAMKTYKEVSSISSSLSHMHKPTTLNTPDIVL